MRFGLPCASVAIDACGSPAGRALERLLDPVPRAEEAGPTAVTLRFDSRIEPSGRRFHPYPIWPARDGVIVADAAGRGAHLTTDAPSGGIVHVHPEMDLKSVLLWVYLPLVRAVAWSTGSVMLHASAFRYRGLTLAVAAWQGTGKSLILLDMLAHGAEHLADDWVVVDREGTVWPVSAHLNLTADHRARLPRSWRAGPVARLSGGAIAGLRGAARRTGAHPLVSAGFGYLADVARVAGKRKVVLDEVFPSARVGEPSALDVLVTLSRPGTAVPARTDLADFFADSAAVEWPHAYGLQAGLRAVVPGARAWYAEPAEEGEAAARAVSRAHLLGLAFDGLGDRSATRAILGAAEGMAAACAG